MNYSPIDLIGVVGNYPLYAKKIFLTILQAWFSGYDRVDNRFYWTNDFKTTKIVIVDKRSYDVTRTDIRPAIVLSRGPLYTANIAIDQLSSFNMETHERTYTDLLPMTVSINCISKNGTESEELASIVFNAITAYKSKLRGEGVFDIKRLAMGGEVNLRNDVNDIFSNVPVEVNFLLQSHIANSYKYYPLTVKYVGPHYPEVQDTPPNPYWEIPPKTWFEPTRSLTLNVPLTEDTHYAITSGMLDFTLDGYLGDNDAPQDEYFVVSGELSLTGPNDGTDPSIGSSEDLLTPGYLPKGDMIWKVWYTRGDTLEPSLVELNADKTTTLFSLPGGIYGYGEIFEVFTPTMDVVDE